MTRRPPPSRRRPPRRARRARRPDELTYHLFEHPEHGGVVTLGSVGVNEAWPLLGDRLPEGCGFGLAQVFTAPTAEAAAFAAKLVAFRGGSGDDLCVLQRGRTVALLYADAGTGEIERYDSLTEIV